jgi:RNase H-fold protein (predicted Holliday junction resolvase)
MKKDSTTKIIGLDVHSKTISVAIAFILKRFPLPLPMKGAREKSDIMELSKTHLKPLIKSLKS